MASSILVVDDDAHIREVICFALQKAGYVTHAASDGAEALAQVMCTSFDLMVLDIGMPEMDGLDVCREVRKTSDLPILFLSARSEEIDRILGLELGGDDYVTKPFSPRELIARIKVILKRSLKTAQADKDPMDILQHGCLTITTHTRDVQFNATSLEMTALEFSILKTFLSRPKMVFTRDQLMAMSYENSVHVSERTIDSHIRNIRAKLAKVNCLNVIETVHGVGFRLGSCEANGTSLS